ncbi:hypothetical protein BC829DRAFT_448103 [Chytridium lagenaria]|nr:hypothetical protein BC829DRAFT_448103 [Chytridium lagenaria]
MIDFSAFIPTPSSLVTDLFSASLFALLRLITGVVDLGDETVSNVPINFTNGYVVAILLSSSRKNSFFLPCIALLHLITAKVNYPLSTKLQLLVTDTLSCTVMLIAMQKLDPHLHRIASLIHLKTVLRLQNTKDSHLSPLSITLASAVSAVTNASLFTLVKTRNDTDDLQAWLQSTVPKRALSNFLGSIVIIPFVLSLVPHLRHHGADRNFHPYTTEKLALGLFWNISVAIVVILSHLLNPENPSTVISSLPTFLFYSPSHLFSFPFILISGSLLGLLGYTSAILTLTLVTEYVAIRSTNIHSDMLHTQHLLFIFILVIPTYVIHHAKQSTPPKTQKTALLNSIPNPIEVNSKDEVSNSLVNADATHDHASALNVPCAYNAGKFEDPDDVKGLGVTVGPQHPSVILPSIFIVDDSLINRRILHHLLLKILTPPVPPIHHHSNGRSALDHLPLLPQLPLVIFMDLQMPILNGIDATRQIREARLWRGIKVVAVTTSRREEIKEAAQFDGWLEKPVGRETVIKCLKRLKLL